jgi:hypothetical protein
VFQPRPRGKLPKGVIDCRSASHWIYLRIGDEAAMVGGKDDGRRVRILAHVSLADRKRLKLEGGLHSWFIVETIGGWQFNYQNDAGQGTQAVAASYEIRRPHRR